MRKGLDLKEKDARIALINELAVMFFMKSKTSILILLLFTFSFAYGQSPRMKKKIEITMRYNYNEWKDGKLQVSKEGVIKRDTIITEYDQDGEEISSNDTHRRHNWGIIKIDSIEVVFQNDTIIHQREFWSDSTIKDKFVCIFQDSLIRIRLSEGDTIRIEKFYNYGNINNQLSGYSNGFYESRIFYHKKNKNRVFATIIKNNFRNGPMDTTRVVFNMRRNIYKTLVYNKDKNEWYIIKKVRYKKSGHVQWTTFYHDHFRSYFTTKTTTKYNHLGLPILVIEYDTYLKHIDVKTTYEYEFY